MPRQFPQEVSITVAVSSTNACQALRLTSRTTLALLARLTGPAPAVPQLHRAEGQAVVVAPRSVTAGAADTTAVAAGWSRHRRWAARSCCAPVVQAGCPVHPSTRPTTPASTGSP